MEPVSMSDMLAASRGIAHGGNKNGVFVGGADTAADPPSGSRSRGDLGRRLIGVFVASRCSGAPCETRRRLCDAPAFTTPFSFARL